MTMSDILSEIIKDIWVNLKDIFWDI
jgi:hypothetical protein